MELLAFLAAKPLLAYLIVFFGVMIEGEGIILLASVFALQGHLSWAVLAPTVILGTIFGDVLWYAGGKYLKGTKFGCWLDTRYERTGVGEWITTRFHWYAILSKFMYFTTRPTIFLAGWHGFEFKKFLKITVYSTIIWAAIMFSVGAAFGYTIEQYGFKRFVHRIEFFAIATFVGIFVIEWVIQKAVGKKTRSLHPPAA
jgi:membrane protein DedA with SNARE-associated domain